MTPVTGWRAILKKKQIVNIYCTEDVMTDSNPDVAKIKPFVLTMPDNRFWALSECIGKAWHEGKGFRKPREGSA